MGRNQKEYRYLKLLDKYKSNELSKSEFEEFLQFLRKNDFKTDTEWDHLIREDWASSLELLDRITQSEGNKRWGKAGIRWISGIAAALVLLIIFVGLVREPPGGVNEPLVFYTGYGETRSIVLPDGSQVLLNANSNLKWDENWKEEGARRVAISGEAFFDVYHFENAMKFVVEADGVNVNVTGTTFNVRDRDGEVDVFLNSGKVNLEILDSLQGNIVMEPGSQVVYDANTNKIIRNKGRTLSNTASWVEGMLEFENEYVPQILHRFEELYGIEFEIESEDLMEKRMDLSLPYSNWDLIKKALEISLNAEFTEVENTIIVK